MRHLVRNLILSITVVIFAVWAFYPPEKQLRLGKDLRGGFSLLYSVQVGPGENPDEVLDQVIAVLKERVDPNGLLEISIAKQGRDRLEITMPLPNDEVKLLRDEFEAVLSEVEAAEVDPRAFDRALRLEPADRASAFERLSEGDAERLALMESAVASFEQSEAARRDFDARVAAGAPQEELDSLAEFIATAQIEVEDARDLIAGSTLEAASVRRALELSDRPRVLYSEVLDGPKEFPSERQARLTELREEHPSAVVLIDRVVDAWNAYEAERTTLDDPSDLIRQLRGSGVLEFRITVNPGDYPDEQGLRDQLRAEGPSAASRSDVRWFKIESLASWASTAEALERILANPPAYFASYGGDGYVVDSFGGEYYMLAWDTPSRRLVRTTGDGDWGVTSAFQGVDQQGQPAINFRMNARGGKLLGDMTRENLRNQMAVLLDDEVYTAPNLIGAISDSGQIVGEFTQEELSDIIRTLNAGSLQAKLSPEPISQSVLGPELGQDNLDAGLRAGVIALIAVSIFMVFYYFVAGGLAVVALACNAALILGALALGRAALTLPGIAGIILTFGMAVDANVLIFERIREEMRKGVDLKPAVRLGYQKALSSIVDGNVTNLIVTLVLAYIGTQEIKGFAITLGIGVVSTLFTALVISRVLFAVLIDWLGMKSLLMLPTAVPVVEKLLEPKIGWLRGRPIFLVLSACYVGLGIGMILYQNEEMLDNEFRGGTEVTLSLGTDEQGAGLTLTRPEVEDRVHAIAESLESGDRLFPLRLAEVLPVNPAEDGITSDTFRIKTVATDADAVLTAVRTEFRDVLDTEPALQFADAATDPSIAPLFPVTTDRLGDSIGEPSVVDDVSAFEGGVAILLRGLEPAPSLDALRQRFDTLRRQPDFSDTLNRATEILVLEGSTDAVEAAAFVVSDPNISVFDGEQRWREDLAYSEWLFAVEALGRDSAPASIRNFDATAAETLSARAIVAVALSFVLISIYIWVRFGALRYSLAALVALGHDVLAAIGLIAFAEILYDWGPAQGFVTALGIQPFKIDLSLIAALLTIIGYSLNDSIIIMDRIRENRGKLDYASSKVVNLSINQTISRTAITSFTTFFAVAILYFSGGEGVRSFAYALLVGVIFGTYSSIAVAAPLVWSRKKDRSAAVEEG